MPALSLLWSPPIPCETGNVTLRVLLAQTCMRIDDDSSDRFQSMCRRCA